jgi:hypothetical protein
VWLADFYWTCFYGITWSLARGRLAPAMAASTLLASFLQGDAALTPTPLPNLRGVLPESRRRLPESCPARICVPGYNCDAWS